MDSNEDNSNHPFGNPDGSRAEIKNLLDGFVKFNNQAVWGGLAIKRSDSSARVLVGRKGSGKTLYLRRLQDYASNDSSKFANQIEQGLPSTEDIIKFCHWFKTETLTEKWMCLWKKAILRSVVQDLLYAPDLHSYIGDDFQDRLTEYKLTEILTDSHCRTSCYDEIKQIIQAHNTEDQINTFLNNNKWIELENILKEVIPVCPPIFLYIDAIDEEFAHAPMYWLRCQKGLFYQTMRFLRDATLGGRLHVTICVRDLVLTSVYRSEHQTRYTDEPHIKILSWNRDSIRHLLKEKIENLDDEYLLKPNNDNPFSRWLGESQIVNGLEIEESIEQYILRHTRLIPRDVVILGNKLCRCVIQQRENIDDLSMVERIKNTVSSVARDFAKEQLQICANHITSNFMPNVASKYDYSNYYTGEKEHIVHEIYRQLFKLIECIGIDRFSYNDIKAAEELFNDDRDYNYFDVLWEHGLLGYLDHRDESTIFYNGDNFELFNLPIGKDTYVFHPCIFDLISIKTTDLIIPFRAIL